MSSQSSTAPQQTNVRSGDARLNVLSWGDPASPPVLLLHGLSSNAWMWERFAQDAAGTYHLVAMDARGHGDSSAPPDGYDPRTMLMDVLAVLDAFSLEKVAVIGHSMGGRIAAHLAAEHPERVGRLVVVDIGVDVEREGRDRIRGALSGAPEKFPTREAARTHIAHMRPRYPADEVERRVEHALRLLSDGYYGWKYDQRAVLRIFDDSRQIPMAPLAGKVRCPTLLVRGELSDLLSAGGAARTAELMGAKLATVAGGGHSLISEQPEQFAAIVLQFLEPWSAAPPR